MARVVMVGGGVVGLGLGMLLANDGHEVEALERDPSPPPDDLDDAWSNWERRGVAQFRLAHMFLARYRQIIEAELPALVSALEAGGALRTNPLLEVPDDFTGGSRDGDDRFEILSGRRVMVERTAAVVAENTPRLTVRRGVAVSGLLTGREVVPGVPHIVGVRTEDGSEISADVVIDVSGRRSALPAWLRDVGAQPPDEVLEDSGFVYYGRHYRSLDGSLPASFGPALQEYGSISSLTLGGDNGYWATALIARADDKELRRLKDVPAWEKTFRSLPMVAHWLDAEAVEDKIVMMSKIEDRIRTFSVNGRPVVTGLLAAADAWACTNPSLGRGASIGMMHACLVRDCLRASDADDPARLAEAFNVGTETIVKPWYDSTVAFDRNRLAEMGALAEHRPLGELPPDHEIGKALASAVLKDPDCFRAFLDIALVQSLPDAVLARPGLLEKIVELGGGWRDEPALGPDRDELVSLVNS